jgi:hypothetical protein
LWIRQYEDLEENLEVYQELNAQTNKVVIHELVQKDMEFMKEANENIHEVVKKGIESRKESCANMAKDEENKDIAHHERNYQPFQLVVGSSKPSKAKNKSMKSYSPRKRVRDHREPAEWLDFPTL